VQMSVYIPLKIYDHWKKIGPREHTHPYTGAFDKLNLIKA